MADSLEARSRALWNRYAKPEYLRPIWADLLRQRRQQIRDGFGDPDGARQLRAVLREKGPDAALFDLLQEVAVQWLERWDAAKAAGRMNKYEFALQQADTLPPPMPATPLNVLQSAALVIAAVRQARQAEGLDDYGRWCEHAEACWQGADRLAAHLTAMQATETARSELGRKGQQGADGHRKDAREFCVRTAADWWAKQADYRIGEVCEHLRVELREKGLWCPKSAKTIRDWLNAANKAGRLPIPEDARKPGRPSN